MQASVTLLRSMEHQFEALKLLKTVYSQQMTNDSSCVITHGGDRCPRGKDVESAASEDTNPLPVLDIDLCGRSNLNSRSGAARGAIKRPKFRTLAEKARESVLRRLIDIASGVISVEEDICRCASDDQRILLCPKDSIDLRNVCTRMSRDGYAAQSERDLGELRDCLKRIVHSLMSSLSDSNNHVISRTRERLRDICLAFPDI